MSHINIHTLHTCIYSYICDNSTIIIFHQLIDGFILYARIRLWEAQQYNKINHFFLSSHYAQAMCETPKYLVCVHQQVCSLLAGPGVGRWEVNNEQFKYQLKAQEGCAEIDWSFSNGWCR